jgi:hypothetical protein
MATLSRCEVGTLQETANVPAAGQGTAALSPGATAGEAEGAG